MLDHLSRSDVPPSADPLTRMLQGLRLDGVEYGRCRLAEPWAYRFPQQQHAQFYFVVEKGLWLLRPSGEWMWLNPGDAVLLPRGDAHTLASRPDVTAIPFPHCQCKTIGENLLDFACGQGTEGCLLFFGTLQFHFDGLHPLLRMMPDVMHANALMRNEPTIPHLLDAMACEVAMNRAGANGIVTRLADVLAAQIIRSWVEHGCGNATGWIAAVRDPEIGRVLAAIHADPGRDWSIMELAKLMGASRSSFAGKFAAIVGETPAHYVARVRMHQARQWLLRDRARVSEVAQRLGYDSEASFSRAFKRITGSAPSHLRARNAGDLSQDLSDFGALASRDDAHRVDDPLRKSPALADTSRPNLIQG
jgi:AraC-like DNA-binding protein